jgi:hypothetical protein
MSTIGGTMVCHNCFEFDYCLEAAIDSLLPVCDEVIIVDAESTDDTSGFLKWKSHNERKIRIIPGPWIPNKMGKWLATLGNLARETLTTDFHFHLQADEVIHEDSYHGIRKIADDGVGAVCIRLNFWHDHRHLLPPGRHVSREVVRLAPIDCPLVGDAESILMDGHRFVESEITIFHYGFIRDSSAYVAKAKPMHTGFFGFYDPQLDAIEKDGKSAMTNPSVNSAVPMEQLFPFNGNHPKVARKWLTDHGYDL